nr:endonuclease NucS domain-containing protein [Pseudanabaena sp. FACHB-2040]
MLNLEPLARQYATQGQYCDILATDWEQQLVVLELKNVEDRYVVSQLTRYYASLFEEKPFSERVDYGLPIRLVAIAPSFHSHNYVDQQHSRLDFEFWTFEVVEVDGKFTFELKSSSGKLIGQTEIPPTFHSYLVATQENLPKPERVISRPPKSFRTLLDKLPQGQQEYLLKLRQKVLDYDERMIEVGLTARTQYGLRKGEKAIYQTKSCVEILSQRPFDVPVLHLMLPYPKKEFGAPGHRFKEELVRGDAWAIVPLLQEQWEAGLCVGFFLGKGRQSPSFRYVYTVERYTRICEQLLGRSVSLCSTEDFIEFALNEWQKRLMPKN